MRRPIGSTLAAALLCAAQRCAPREEREWLRAAAAELPSISTPGEQLAWSTGACTAVARCTLRRALDPLPVWVMACVGGLVIAALDARVSGTRMPLLLALTALAGGLALKHPRWPWRWGLVSGSSVPLFAFATGFTGPYLHDRFDAFYALVPAAAAAWLGSSLRGRRVWAAPPAFVLLGVMGLCVASQERGGADQPGGPGYVALEDARFSAAVVEVRPLVERMQAGLHAPGLGIAVAVDGELVWSEGRGWADREARIPVTRESRFRIGSVSKPFTAVAAAVLAERGKLDWDAPIQALVPDFPDKGGVITARLLAGHLSGIRHYRVPVDPALERNFGSLAGALAEVRDDPLVGPPGEQYFYSSYGYALLGTAIEQASGRDFLSALDELVLAPLELHHTCADRLDGHAPDWVQLYEHPDPARDPVLAPEIDYAGRWPGAGLRSTPEDLARFGAALLEGRLLAEASREAMFRTQHTRAGEPTGYGLGWMVAPIDGPSPIAGHLGHAHGGSALLFLDRENHVALAICANVATVTAPQAEPASAELPEPPRFIAPFAAVRRSGAAEDR